MGKELVERFLTLQFVPCHRRPDRSLFIRGMQFPVCARCMAILLGYFSIPFLFWFQIHVSILLGILFNVPMILDGLTQLKKWRESTNFLRIATGLCSGIGQSMIVISISTVIVNHF